MVAICPRDARPNRPTPDLGRPCELDAKIRVGRSRPCLLCAHRFSADSVQFDRPALSRCVPMGPVLCQERKRDARPNRSTPNLSRPCELDAGIRGGRSRPCLLCAHRFSADSVRVDAGRLARPRPCARARSDDSGKGGFDKLDLTRFFGPADETALMPRRDWMGRVEARGFPPCPPGRC